MKITELTGKAYKKALSDERKAEWDGKRTYTGEVITEKDLVDFSLANHSEYDLNGNWLGYGKT